jgi:hypothetical protein
MTLLRHIAIGVGLLLAHQPLKADDKAAPANETSAKSKVVAVDLFKNGLAVIKREVSLGKPGVYVLEDVPSPVLGTYWIESAGQIDSLVQMRDVEVPANESAPANLQEDLAGRKVTIHLKGDKRAPVTGTMMKFKHTKPEEEFLVSKYVVVQTAKGRVYVDAAEVASIESDDAGDKVRRRQPRLLLTLTGTDKPETKVAVHYLTHGISWAASYRLDISDPKSLTLEQRAVIRNEMGEFEGAEVRLISGYPSVQFAHVRSLISPGQTWAGFFQEVGGVSARLNAFDNNSITTQNMVMPYGNRRAGTPVALGATPTGEGVDLHYQSIGKRSLKEGDALSVTVAKGKAEYERIVEWVVPDTRNDYGQLAGRSVSDETDGPWDALKFKNPLPFAMTTGPAMVTANGTFNGQRTTYFVNAGEETVMHVGKALSVRTRSLENEVIAKKGGDRDLIWIGGRQFRKSVVEGELTVCNHRKESIPMVIRRQFSGELNEAEGSPRSSLREEGVYSINKRFDLVWSLSLKPGEEKTLKYSYSVLVPF